MGERNERRLENYLVRKDSDDLYITDEDENLIFLREKTSEGGYNLTVILDGPVSVWWVEPHETYGIQIYEDLTRAEWKKLVNEYMRHKKLSETCSEYHREWNGDPFKKWLDENISLLQKEAIKTSAHLKLLKIGCLSEIKKVQFR